MKIFKIVVKGERAIAFLQANPQQKFMTRLPSSQQFQLGQ